MFRRKSGGVDTVDFTRTKKGERIPEPKQDTPAPIVGGFLDFTSPAPQSSSTSTQIDPAPNTFGFLSDFSQSAATSDSFSSASSIQSSSAASNDDVNAMKIKLDDLEYKLERLLERLTEIETKFSRA